MTRPGFYVEGKYFAHRLAQATARANFLATEYRRDIAVLEVGHDRQQRIIHVSQFLDGYKPPPEAQQEQAA